MKRSSKPRKTGKRPLGLFRGEIWIAPDFDAPMELVESSKLAALEALKSGAPKKKAKVRRSGKKSRPSRV
jgi:hypothetical protein